MVVIVLGASWRTAMVSVATFLFVPSSLHSALHGCWHSAPMIIRFSLCLSLILKVEELPDPQSTAMQCRFIILLFGLLWINYLTSLTILDRRSFCWSKPVWDLCSCITILCLGGKILKQRQLFMGSFDCIFFLYSKTDSYSKSSKFEPVLVIRSQKRTKGEPYASSPGRNRIRFRESRNS